MSSFILRSKTKMFSWKVFKKQFTESKAFHTQNFSMGKIIYEKKIFVDINILNKTSIVENFIVRKITFPYFMTVHIKVKLRTHTHQLNLWEIVKIYIVALVIKEMPDFTRKLYTCSTLIILMGLGRFLLLGQYTYLLPFCCCPSTSNIKLNF